MNRIIGMGAVLMGVIAWIPCRGASLPEVAKPAQQERASAQQQEPVKPALEAIPPVPDTGVPSSKSESVEKKDRYGAGWPAIRDSVQKIRYKSTPQGDLFLHVFAPEPSEAETQEKSKNGKRPAIVFFFGGGWVSGTPQQFYRQAWYLSRRGMVAICAEYRVRSRHQTGPGECVEDGKSAIRFVRQHAQQWGVDPDRVVAAGGSAGGHVAAATATLNDYDATDENAKVSSRPNALVLFNAVVDNGPDGWGHATVQSYWQSISPLHQLRSPVVPSLFLLGDKDDLLPVSVAQQWKDSVERLGGRCDVEITEGAGHGYFNQGPAFEETLRRTDQFLVSLGMLSGQEQVQLWMKEAEASAKPPASVDPTPHDQEKDP